jgi:hypothetical protein
VESKRLCTSTNVRVNERIGYAESEKLTDDASDEDAKTELSFDLRPRYPFRFTSEHVPIDILTA